MGQDLCTNFTKDNKEKTNPTSILKSKSIFQTYNINSNYNFNYNINYFGKIKSSPESKNAKQNKTTDFDISSEIGKILILEQKIKNEEISQNIVKDLMMTYAKIVEHYDHTKDPIKTYFLDKIQNFLSNRKIIQFLKNEKNAFDIKINSYTNITDNMYFESLDYQTVTDSNNNYEQSVYLEDLKKKKNDLSPHKNAITRIQNLKIYANINLSQQKKEKKNLITKFIENRKNLDQIITYDINAQYNIFQSKLEKRISPFTLKKSCLVLNGFHKKAVSVQYLNPNQLLNDDSN